MNIENLELSASAYSRLKRRGIETVEHLKLLTDDDLEIIFGRGELFTEVKEKLQTKITNGDRIRAMSDEELANIICCPKDVTNHLCDVRDCVECCLDWLKQPAKEEA